MKRAIPIVVAVIVVLCVYTVWANVISDDTDVRSVADLTARAKAGCGEKCVMTKMEGTRGVLAEDIDFSFRDGGNIHVKCKRAAIAFGAYKCEAAKVAQ
jgi:hypothetical protein